MGLRHSCSVLARCVAALGCALLASACASSDAPSPPIQDPSGKDAGVSVSFDAASRPDASGGIDAGVLPSDASISLFDGSSAYDGGSNTSTRGLSMNEVSILFPLPATTADRDVLLSASASGVGGPLVPRALYDRATPLLTALMPDEAYLRLRAVSARIDPCPQRITDQTCAPELRLVFQPVSGDGPTTTTEDAALHAVYTLPTDELAALLAAVRGLGAREPELRSGPGALGVHPVMAREGLQGPYAQGLRALLLGAAGEGRLRRLTFMQLSGRANIWIFGGFDRNGDGSFSPTRIASVAGETQRITHNVFTDDLQITVTPSVLDGDDFSLLYDSNVSRAAPVQDRDAALSAALRVENPLRHDADSVDCARCHVAFVARRWTERVLRHDTSQDPDRFTAPGYDLTAPEVITPPTSLRNFRAFGWLGREPAISQRTVNETAIVLEELR